MRISYFTDYKNHPSDVLLREGLAELNVDFSKDASIYFTTGPISLLKSFDSRKNNINLVRSYWPTCPKRTSFNCGGIGLKKCLWCYSFSPKIFYPYFLTKKARKLLDKCELVIARSNFVRTYLKNKGIKCDSVLFPPIKIPEGMASHDNNTILFAGKLIPEKGLRLLLAALTDIEYDFKLVVAGKGNTFFYRRLSKKLGLEKKVSFFGHIPHTKVMDIMQNSSIFVLPSLWEEPMSRAMLEAASHAMAVVATNTGGTPEFLNQKNGILVKPKKEELGNAIKTLLASRKLRKKLGQKARTDSKRFDYKTISKKFLSMLEQAF